MISPGLKKPLDRAAQGITLGIGIDRFVVLRG